MPCLPDEQTAVIESEMVKDAFTKVGLRAANTSDQRLWQEKLRWERKLERPGLGVFPVQEGMVYQYIKRQSDWV